MKKNIFENYNDKFKIKPHISSKLAEDEVAKKILKAYLSYWGTFALWLVVSYNFIPMIFYLVCLMFVMGGFSAKKLPAESYNIAKTTKQTVFYYIVGLMAWRLIQTIILKTPVELWQKAFQTKVEPAFANAFLGFISMGFMVGIFMGFIGYCNYIFQLNKFHKGSKTVKEHMRKLLRKENFK